MSRNGWKAVVYSAALGLVLYALAIATIYSAMA